MLTWVWRLLAALQVRTGPGSLASLLLQRRIRPLLLLRLRRPARPNEAVDKAKDDLIVGQTPFKTF